MPSPSVRWPSTFTPGCSQNGANSFFYVKTLCRILQETLDEDSEKEDVVVNAIYPATPHSKINQSNIALTDVREGARLIFFMATSRKNTGNIR